MKVKSQSLVVSVSLGGVLLIILILSAIARNKSKALRVPQEQTGSGPAAPGSGPLRYLPEGARINDQNRDVVFADIDGDGQKEEIIFYSVVKSPADRKAGVLILKRSGADYVRFWERIYVDSGGFAYPTGIYDLAKRGKLQIFAYRTIGT